MSKTTENVTVPLDAIQNNIIQFKTSIEKGAYGEGFTRYYEGWLTCEIFKGYNISIFDETNTTVPVFSNAIVTNGTKTFTFLNQSNILINAYDISGQITITANDAIGLYQQRVIKRNIDQMNNPIEYLNIYLIKISESHHVDINVLDNLDVGISGALVNISRQYGYDYIPVTECITDSSGYCFVYLNDSATYRYVVSKTGYTTKTEYNTPTDTKYTFNLASSAYSGNITYISNWSGISSYLYPTDNLLMATDSQTFRLNFSVNDLETLDYWGLLLQNNGATIFNQSKTSKKGIITANINTTNYTGSINARIYIRQSGYDEAYRDYVYKINTLEDKGNFTVTNLFKGINNNNFGSFGSILLGIFALLIAVGIMSVTGFEYTGSYMIGLIVLGFFVFIGWLDWKIFLFGAIISMAIVYYKRSY